MLQNGFFFALGFLAAAFLAAAAAPPIWRRAVAITRQRIEASVPLTLNEIQADKDQLRAEFAMSTRRLEMSLDSLKERAAEQLIEINRRRDDMLSLEEEQTERTQRINELEAQAAELRAELRAREEKLSSTSVHLASTEARLEEKALAFDELERRYSEAVDEYDGQKIEMVARETRMEAVQEAADETRDRLKERSAETKRLKSELKHAQTALERESDRYAQASAKLERTQATLADLEARLERREADLTRLRAGSEGGADERVRGLDVEVDRLSAEKIALETKLAEQAVRMEALVGEAAGHEQEQAVAAFEAERRDLQAELDAVRHERDTLRAELSAAQLAASQDWEVERRENALVRERINDLAAQVTAMAAALEGPDGPIEQALSKAPSAPAGDGAPQTLAERIRALQAMTQAAS